MLHITTMKDNLITIAIRSFEQAQSLAETLEKAGIKAVLHAVGKNHESFGIGMRVRINENDLPKALNIIENPDKKNEKGESSPTPKRILVPIDFSDYSLQACEIAFRIAEKFAANEIVLLHAYILPNSFVTLSGRRAVASADKEETRHFLTSLNGDMINLKQKIQAKIDAKLWANVKFSTITVEGVPENHRKLLPRTATHARGDGNARQKQKRGRPDWQRYRRSHRTRHCAGAGHSRKFGNNNRRTTEKRAVCHQLRRQNVSVATAHDGYVQVTDIQPFDSTF